MSLATVSIKFLADLKGFSSQMQNVNRSIAKTGRNLQQTGKSLSVGLSLPLASLGTVAVNSAVKFEKLQTSLSVLTGSAAAGAAAFERLQKFSASTPFQLDELVSVNNQLLGFGLNADQAFKALQMLGDVSSVSGAELSRVAVAFGQSAAAGRVMTQDLNQFINNGIPIYQLLGDVTGKNVGELRDLASQGGITFDLLEKAFKKGTSEGGKFFEGTIKLSKTLGGRLSTLRDNFNLALGELGNVIGDGLGPVIDFTTKILQKIQNLSPETKKWVVILGGVAAAIGPLLALAGTILPAIITGFTLITGPVGLFIAALTAVGVIIARNWQPIKKVLIDIANYFIDLYNESTAFRIAAQAIITVFKNIFEVGKFAFETLKNIVSSFIDRATLGFKTIGQVVKAALTGNFEEIPDIIRSSLSEGRSQFTGFTDELAKDWKKLTKGIEKNTNDAIKAIVTKPKIEFLKEDVNAEGVKQSVQDAAAAGMAAGLSSGSTAGGSGLSLEDELNFNELENNEADLAELDNLVAFDLATLEAEAETFNNILSNAYEQAAADQKEKFVDPFVAEMERIHEIAKGVGLAVADAFGKLSSDIVGSLNLADKGFQGFVKGLIQTITKLIQLMLAQSISQAIAGATASGTATGPLAVFTTPGFISTAVGGVLSAFAAIPKFATGGLVGGSSFYGDKILARVNSGELILNQDQQRTLYSQLSEGTAFTVAVEGEFNLSGEDMQLSLDRTGRSLKRFS
jgi:tape measure domain-containing protein